MNCVDERLRFPYENKEKVAVNYSDIVRVYSRLADDESKMIFSNRLMFSLTNDWYFMKKMLLETGTRKQIDTILGNKSDCKLFIYGAGISGKRVPLIFNDYNWLGYIDKNKKGQSCNGLPIYGLENFQKMVNSSVILISNLSDVEEIKQELNNIGIDNSNIISLFELTKEISKKMYFDDLCINKNNLCGKTFIDAGAFDGNDSIKYLNWIKDDTAKVIAFEADKTNFQLAQKNLKEFGNVKIVNKGLSDADGKRMFDAGKGEMSNFSEDGNEIIDMTYLDKESCSIEIGYIKMDIEGYEKKALLGAVGLIEQFKPDLGISVYHKREDIWEIPKLILDINSNYKFYLRHYSLGTVDTVLYAV